jgi:hypothetical protein
LPWNTTTSVDGTHFLSAVATDLLGNPAISNSVSVERSWGYSAGDQWRGSHPFG